MSCGHFGDSQFAIRCSRSTGSLSSLRRIGRLGRDHLAHWTRQSSCSKWQKTKAARIGQQNPSCACGPAAVLRHHFELATCRLASSGAKFASACSGHDHSRRALDRGQLKGRQLAEARHRSSRRRPLPGGGRLGSQFGELGRRSASWATFVSFWMLVYLSTAAAGGRHCAGRSATQSVVRPNQ